MTRTRLATALLSLGLVATLAGCGSGTVRDAAGGSASESPTPSPMPSPTSSPTPSPDPLPPIGDHPAYPYADYAYVLEVQCFCPTFGQPVRVTVTDGEVTGATWTHKAPDHAKGDETDLEWLRLSINDVLTEAADPSYDDVEVTWPAGQDHPDSVAIDRLKMAIDDEVTYLLSDVQPAA
ncbi:MAG: DUF6174 domain-containing protein [Nocardioides sp.]